MRSEGCWPADGMIRCRIALLGIRYFPRDKLSGCTELIAHIIYSDSAAAVTNMTKATRIPNTSQYATSRLRSSASILCRSLRRHQKGFANANYRGRRLC
jgi:hypothetical protein